MFVQQIPVADPRRISHISPYGQPNLVGGTELREGADPKLGLAEAGARKARAPEQLRKRHQTRQIEAHNTASEARISHKVIRAENGAQSALERQVAADN